MDTIKTLAVALIAAVAVGVVVLMAQPEAVGGVPGVSILPVSQTPSAYMVLATSTGSNSTLLTSDIDQESWIDMTLNSADGTLTFPASSSFPGIPNTGDVRTIWVRNATTTSGIDLTIAGNTGVALKRAASSTATIVGDTDGKNTMQLEFVRLPNTDIVMYLSKFED